MADAGGSRQNVTFPSNGGQAHGYLATPPSGQGAGVVVIQEWWGLTDHIAGIADRLAAEGFVTLAPDLYGGATTHDAEEAGEMMGKLPPDQAARDLAGAVDFLLGRDDVQGDGIGVVGFCMGGAFVLTLAVQEGGKIAAAVPFYPVGTTPDDYAGLQAAVMAHFGEEDAFLPIEQADELAAGIKAGTGREPFIHRYPAGHAFHNDENLIGTYDPEQAGLAWDRTVAFLHEHLG
ncbi:MAG TPA: dienelactone hydrolase family protein [Acidimicrobiales bacterium]|nr:dienelactone hydrolase family protein [Acidimicrobiales bacterium]